MLVSEQQFEILAGNTAPCTTKWLIGLNHVLGYIRLYFRLVSVLGTEEQANVKINLHLVKDTGEPLYPMLYERSLPVDEEFFTQNHMQFNTSRPTWENFIHGDTLILKIGITSFVPKPTTSNKTGNVTRVTDQFNKRFLAKLQDDFAALLSNSSSTDIKIIFSDGTEFECHSHVLAARCPVCMSGLGLDTESPTRNDTIVMKNVSSKTMDILLQYFYTGKLLEAWKDQDTIENFLLTSKEFQLSGILEFLDKIIGRLDKSKYNMKILDAVKLAGLPIAAKEIERDIIKRSTVAKNASELLEICSGLKTLSEKHICD